MIVSIKMSITPKQISDISVKRIKARSYVVWHLTVCTNLDLYMLDWVKACTPHMLSLCKEAL